MMQNTKRFLIVICCTCAAQIGFTQPAFRGWVVEKESTLSVKGKSNVNSFICDINGYFEKDTLLMVKKFNNVIHLSGSLSMDVQRFNCHSSLITNDLRKTLKSKQYPKMIIRFLSLQKLPELKNKKELIKGLIEVELAGVVKRFELIYSFTQVSGKIKLHGGRSFCFSDFRLSPPKKLAGLIKIKDEFDVDFRLSLISL